VLCLHLVRKDSASAVSVESCLFCLILLSLPWLVWQAVRKGKYREGLRREVLGAGATEKRRENVHWLHAVSVGEVNLLAPLLKNIEQEQPEWECVVSTTTTTGMELAKKNIQNTQFFYCPLDFSWAVNARCGESGRTCLCWRN